MAPTVLTVNTITQNGSAPVAEVAGDVANTNILASNNGVSTWIEATNTVAAVATVTVVTPNTVAGLAIADKVYSLPATIGAKLRMGPFDIGVYGLQPAVTASAATVTLAAYQI